MHMNEPLKDSPLALLSKKSVQPGDQVPNETFGFSPVNPDRPLVNQKLKANASHKWYYYPDMTANEVIAFTQLNLKKGEEPTECHSVFHTAFNDPTTPEGSAKRMSCEFRAPLLLK